MIGYEMGVTQTQKLGVSAEMSCGVINSTANLLGSLAVLALTPYLKTNQTDHSMIAMGASAGMLAVAFFLTLNVSH
jgi:hypothetical protein